jgi:signal transduction histidine kinase
MISARIAVMTEIVKNRVDVTDSDSQQMLAGIADTSRGLVDGMSDIVWSIDPRRDHLGDVVSRLRAFGSDVLEARGIRWSCDGPSGALDQRLSLEQRRQFYLIFKEAIHNIARHSQARSVALRIAVYGDMVTCELEDDGRGISANGGEGLGIASMRRRASRLGGVFRIAARPEGGTATALHFRLRA